jgi:hypothetical protein
MRRCKPVNDRLSARVEIIKLHLRHGVVDVHRWHRQLPGLGELVQPVHARHAFLDDSYHKTSPRVFHKRLTRAFKNNHEKGR